jgi:Zn-dependent oligopeptidase
VADRIAFNTAPEEAALVGFSSYAELSLASKMAQTLQQWKLC